MSDDIDTIEETAGPAAINRELVADSVRDWLARLHTFFQTVRTWAVEHGWRVDDSGTVGMHEEPMQRFNMAPTTQPTLRLEKDGGYALFKPKGLWVIGANGRIDLYTSKGTFIIVDLAERGMPPRWTIFRASHKREGDPFEPEIIGNLT
jgi:hypothetical protein